MIYSVDRIEGTVAVLVGDSGPDLTVLLSELPAGITEGSVLRFNDGVYTLDCQEEQKRRQRILSLEKKLRGL